MSFKHFSAVKTLKGKLECMDRKCRFSVTRASAPTHSAYKASASLSPFVSYFAPNSKGIRKSSSMVVKMLMNLTKSWNSLRVKFALTSSTIIRHIEIECEGKLSMRSFKSDSHLCFLKSPKANIYSLASRTSRKFSLPELFPDFTQMANNFFFAHPGEWRRSFRYTLAHLLPQSFGFCLLIFHSLSPCFRRYYEVNSLSRVF